MLNVIRKNNIHHWPASPGNTSQEFENEARINRKLERPREQGVSVEKFFYKHHSH